MVLKTKPKALIHSAVAFAEQLRITCRNHLLWAYNECYLLLLEKYIQAKLRQSQRIPKYGWHNQSLFSRLPKWLVVAKNRPSVLTAIAKLKCEKL